MKKLLTYLILLIAMSFVFTGCSYRTVIRIINLSESSITVEYVIKNHSLSGDFNLKNRVFKVKNESDTDYNNEIRNTTFNENLLTASVSLEPFEVLELAEIHGFYDDAYRKSEKFNLKSIKIKSKNGEMVASGDLLFSFFQKIDDYDFGIILK